MGTFPRAGFLPATLVAGFLVSSPPLASSADAQISRGDDRFWQNETYREPYDRGYREGIQQGQQDGRQNRSFNLYNEPAYRAGDRGYERRFGDRNTYRNFFRSGFEDGYRAGFGRVQGRWVDQFGGRRPGVAIGRQRIYQETALSRGYNDGYEQGLKDGRDNDRYDPVAKRDYRDGDNGYTRSYGTREAYRNNYRAGFREGYEAGYREASRYGRR
jgi:flagellar biosynthesis/type III secretory pathway protein FliH